MSVLRFLEQDLPLSHYDPAQQVVLLYYNVVHCSNCLVYMLPQTLLREQDAIKSCALSL